MMLQELPKPAAGVPLTAEDYDYKTYYVQRVNGRYDQQTGTYGKGLVYLIADDIDSVKIGISRNVSARIRTLSLASGKELRLVSTYQPKTIEYNVLERQLHSHFNDSRTIGEWFKMELSKEQFLKLCREKDK